MADPVSDVAVRTDYIYKILTNFLDLFSDEDREFLSRYWGGMLQVTEDMYLQLYQNDLSKNINTVPVFRRSKWNEIIFTTGITSAEIPSTVISNTYDTSTITGDNTLTLTVDGIRFTVTFTDTAINPIINVVNEINAAATAAMPGLALEVASHINGRITLTSVDFGSESSIEIDSLDGNAVLGFYGGVSAVGSGYSSRSEPAQLIGANSSSIMDTSIANGTNSIKIDVNEEGSKTINFPNDSTTTVDQVINAINEIIPGIASISEDNRIVLTSLISGRESSITIPLGGGNSEVGFTSGQFSLGSGVSFDSPIPERPVSYELAIGTVNDNLELVILKDLAIVSIPALRNLIDGATLVFGQADSPHLGTEEQETNFGTTLDPNAELVSNAFVIRNNRIHFSKEIESQWINSGLTSMWAEDVYRNDDYLIKNFGFPIQYERNNSIAYKNVLQGLHHSYWTGPIKHRTEVGLSLLFDLPVAPRSGKIESITSIASPELMGIEASNTFDVSGDSRTFSFTIDGKFVFVVFAIGQPLIMQQNYPGTSVIADINAAAIPVLGFPPASLHVPDPSQPTISQVKLTGLQSVRVDTVTGNSGIGFPPGALSFGEAQITIAGEDFEISTEFPITKQVGDMVEKLDPLTDGVEILHYITDPIWWEVFGLSTLDSEFNLSTGYTQDDLDIINNLLKYHIFGVKIIPDAFTRIQPLEVSVVSKFINDIRGITKNFIFLIPFMLLDVATLTDDSDYDGITDISQSYTLIYPSTLDSPYRNLIGTAENPGIDIDSTSFSVANSGITDQNFSDGTFTGDTTAFELDNEDIYALNGGVAYTIIGVGSSYIPAIYVTTNSGPFDTTSWSFPFSFQPDAATISVYGGTGEDQIPIGISVPAMDIANAIQKRVDNIGTIFNKLTMSITLDQRIQFRTDRVFYDTGASSLYFPFSHSQMGIPSGTFIVGNGGTLLKTVDF